MSAIARATTNRATRDAMTEDAAGMMGLALAIQGADALICTREHAAYHEAGHAVMSAISGLRVYSVEVFRRGGAWLGWTNSAPAWKVNPLTDPQADLRQARVLLAGPLAELAFSGKPAFGAGIDEIAVAKAIVGSASYKLGMSHEGLMMQIMMETIDAMKRKRLTLDALAGALMRKPKIKQGELARLLARL